MAPPQKPVKPGWHGKKVALYEAHFLSVHSEFLGS